MNTTGCPIARWANEAPTTIALKVYHGISLSYAEWHAHIDRYEAALAKHSVKSGQRVALCLECSVDYLTVLIALFRMGAVACPIDPAFPEAYRAARLAQLDCQHVIVDENERTSPDSGWISLVELRNSTAPSAHADTTTTTWPLDSPATIVFTSGSTGQPKAAVLSLGNHVANAAYSNINLPLATGDVWLLSLPLHHVAGLGILFRCIQAGATIGIPDAIESLEGAAEDLGATHFSLVARQLARLLDTSSDTAVLSRAKGILLGGSAIPTALLATAQERGLPIFTSYGMTEMATQVTTTPPGANLETLRSSGQAQQPDAIRIGAADVIEVNGLTRFLGYWEHGALREPFDGDGWFTTGDRGYFDERGNLHITGRADNMFVSGGENIQPECVERALCDLDGITQAVVVPIPHPEFGATPVAFVEDATHRTPADIQEALSSVLPPCQHPRHLLPWPNALAREGMKINRAAFIREAEQTLQPRH
jgi:o-succinylbenzoate---CoA ligase